ncbi:PilW family protein [Bacillus andreraoultii]|uniref:PilW family protein n=1 Tax=Bacillus andreraoultii TaxID=1499685 RepID=UPI001CA30E73|nr:prepilin-type N-terminal cleavage/methylation domain-containing protein [Bacillus andreraoultii]
MRNDNGLTLVELLVALSLLSIILLFASSIFLMSQNQMNIQSKEVQVQTEERLAMNRITRDIRRANFVNARGHQELVINNTDIYKLEGTDLKKNNELIATNIKVFNVSMDCNLNEVKVVIGNLPETTISIRLENGEGACELEK